VGFARIDGRLGPETYREAKVSLRPGATRTISPHTSYDRAEILGALLWHAAVSPSRVPLFALAVDERKPSQGTISAIRRLEERPWQCFTVHTFETSGRGRSAFPACRDPLESFACELSDFLAIHVDDAKERMERSWRDRAALGRAAAEAGGDPLRP